MVRPRTLSLRCSLKSMLVIRMDAVFQEGTESEPRSNLRNQGPQILYFPNQAGFGWEVNRMAGAQF